MARVQHDRVQAHPTGARLPQVPLRAAQLGQLLPGLPAVGRAEQGGVFHPGVDRVWIGQRGFEMPDALELPGARCAVVPLVRAGDAVVHERVPHRLPRLAPIVGALDLLPEPAAGLRRIQPMRVSGRALEVVDLPAAKVGATDIPPSRLASDLRTNAPLRVPTSTRTVLIPASLFVIRAGLGTQLLPVPAKAPPLSLRVHLRTQAFFLLPEFGCKRGTEVLRLKYLTNLDLGLRVMGHGAALDPFDRLFH